MSQKKLIFLCLVFPWVGGCVSISTHEKLRKNLQAQKTELEEFRVKVVQFEEKNRELEENLTESDTQRGELEKKITEIRSTYDELVESLKEDIAGGDVGLAQSGGKLTITMGNKVLFRSGSAELQPRGQKILLSVSKSLKKITDNYIQVEGHTDNVRISGSLKGRYPTNWELSADRASSVVRFLQEKGKVSPALLILSAFSEYRPLGSNETSAGREQNRRVEISLIPKKP